MDAMTTIVLGSLTGSADDTDSRAAGAYGRHLGCSRIRMQAKPAAFPPSAAGSGAK